MIKSTLRSIVVTASALLASTALAQVMKLPGQFDVSDSGAATYSVPIEVPPGTAGLEPALSLDYSSQGGNGLLGLGWSLSGLPTIDRCARTVAQDGIKGSVDIDSSDRFCMGGQRLVAISGTYGANNTEYRTEVDSFAKIVSYGTAGTGPQWFKVWTKTGQVFELGNTTNSRLLFGTTVRTWHVNKISDTTGNYLTVTYINDTTNRIVYPSRIDYTINSGLSAYNSVQFQYSSSRLDQYRTYESGTFSRNPYLLTNVKTYEGANLTSDYQIGYIAGTSVRPSRVSSIQLCDGSSPQQCLPATSFTWPSTNDPISFTTSDFLAVGVTPYEFIGDYNGDGLPDFLRVIDVGTPTQARYWMSTTPGAWQGVNTNFPYTAPSPTWNGYPLTVNYIAPYPLDLNADGYSDAVADDLYIYEEPATPEPIPHSFGPNRISSNINNGSGVLTQAVSGTGGANVDAKPVGDLNGDGRDDLLQLRASPNGAIPYYSNGNGTFTAGFAISGLHSDAVIFPGDFNGDGCMDILTQGASSRIFFTCGTPTPWVTVTNWVGSGNKLTLGDYNGDGNTDVLVTHVSNATTLMVSNGSTLVSSGYTGPTQWGKYRVLSGDFNGDMMADLLLVAFSTSGANFGPTTPHQVYLSTGESFVFSSNIANPSGDYSFAKVHDFNGDGVVDFWSRKLGATNENRLNTTNYQPMFISAISDGLGQTTSITYDRLNNNTATYTKGSTASYPDMDLIGGQYVVKDAAVPNGVGGTNTFSYQYEGARYNHQGRRLLGFSKIIVTNPTGIVRTTTYRQDYPFIGKVATVTQVRSGVTLSSITNTYVADIPTPAGTGGQRRQIKLTQTVEVNRDLNGATLPTITTSYTYDSYGNPLTVTVTGSGGDTKTTTNTYSNNTTSWLLGRLLTTQTVHALTGKPSITRKASFQYSATTGLLTREVIEPDNAAMRLQTDYVRDAFGNITSTSVSGTGITTRTTTNVYDSRKRFVVSTTNPELHVEQFQYNAKFGTISSYTDPNNLVSTFLYDGFGRPTRETDPDGRYRDIEYRYCLGVAGGGAACTAHGGMQRISIPRRSGTTTQSGPAVATIFDKLGREIATGNESFNGVNWGLAETTYDGLGRVQRVTRPYLDSGSATQHTTYTYDALGRPITSVTFPDSRTDEYTYNGKITTHTRDKFGLNRTTTTELNDQGLVRRVTEPGSVITQYSYNAVGDLLETTDPAGNKITHTVDVRGRITQRIDPSLGTQNFVYDRLDQLTQQTDAKSQVTTYAYDRLGRMTTLTAPGLTSTFTYDTATNGKGRLREMSTNAGNKRTHTYDSFGRPSTTMFTIEGSTGGFTYTYNSDSRLNTVQYPSGYTVRYEYTNTQRYLQYLKDHATGTNLWTANARNAEGRYTQSTMNLSGGYTVNRAFDAYGRIVDVEAGTGTPKSIADFTFTYNKLGNLTQRQDLNQAVTETFTYDSLDRLTGATIGGVTRSVSYNSVGNITSKTRLGSTLTNTYTYPSAGSARPYAVSSITGQVNGVTNPAYVYDNNGNMTSGAGRTMTWTSFNRVSSVTEGGTTLSYLYDAEHQRIKQTNGSNFTYYLTDPLMGFSAEYETTAGGTYIAYLFADGERVGVRKQTTTPSAITLQGFVHDHLGSVAVVTNSSGVVAQRLAYDAWGRRRQPNGTEDPSGSITAPTTRGFTDHEHLPSVDLINMNARMYDPEIARFVSADPIIPDPLKSQALNRYSYVYNNPGSYTDPSGYANEFLSGGVFPDPVQILIASVISFGLDALLSDDKRDPVYYRPGLAGTNEDLRQVVPLYSTVSYGSENLGVVPLLKSSLGGSKYLSGNNDGSLYTQGDADASGNADNADRFRLYSSDRANRRLRAKINVGLDGVITTETITVSYEGIDESTATAYIEAAEAGWTSIGLDLEIVTMGADIVIRPCSSASVCSVSSIDGGYLGAAQVGGRVIWYGSSQYPDTPVHEFGHIIGLGHAGSQRGSIMTGSRTRSVTSEDLSRIRALYE